MNTDYIIVQAGGKGTRLEHLTKNKPKALVPVENLPMIFHLFRKFPHKKFIIIGDYKKEVLREYLSAFATVEYQLVEAKGTGTCSGVKNALDLLPKQQSFMLVWSDLILPTSFTLPEKEGLYIGISQSFSCRWRYEKGVFAEDPSVEQGVAGLFVFPDKSTLEDVPQSGELVRWLSEKNLNFCELGLSGTREFGILSEYEALEVEKCRPFNKITRKDGLVIKEPVDRQGEDLAFLEENWYRFAQEKGVSGIPEIHSFRPLKMEEIKGKNIYEYRDISYHEKKNILITLVKQLKALHKLGEVEADSFSMKEAYFNKTMDRLDSIRDLVPFASEKNILINGRLCRNVFFHKRELENALEQLRCDKFVFLHGDCTFSNLMLREDFSPVLIDPRGYFGKTKLYGDPLYDWAKLYYSLMGNYDRFNLKEFSLDILEDQVKVEITSNGWEELEDDFLFLSKAPMDDVKLIHAVIWLSLTTYAWQDYDSICAAFYMGLYHLQEVYHESF